MASKHKVFVSYHHLNDQHYKNQLMLLNTVYDLFIDGSVDTGDIDENLSDQAIREKIRDDYLRDTTVTIVLVGTETAQRKHVDWELYSSMFDGVVNKKSGILVVNLPSINCTSYHAAHGAAEKSYIYPECTNWITINERTSFEARYPFMPPRIIDNLLAGTAKISVVPWEKVVSDPKRLEFLVDVTYQDRGDAKYDLSRPMRKNNS